MEGAIYDLYDDDGYTKDYSIEDNTTQITVNQSGEISVDGDRIHVQW